MGTSAVRLYLEKKHKSDLILNGKSYRTANYSEAYGNRDVRSFQLQGQAFHKESSLTPEPVVADKHFRPSLQFFKYGRSRHAKQHCQRGAKCYVCN